MAKADFSSPNVLIYPAMKTGNVDVVANAMAREVLTNNEGLATGVSYISKEDMMEYEVEAEFLHEFYRKGAQAPAYTSIVAGGANACTLHYVQNDQPLKNGDLVRRNSVFPRAMSPDISAFKGFVALHLSPFTQKGSQVFAKIK